MERSTDWQGVDHPRWHLEQEPKDSVARMRRWREMWEPGVSTGQCGQALHWMDGKGWTRHLPQSLLPLFYGSKLRGALETQRSRGRLWVPEWDP